MPLVVPNWHLTCLDNRKESHLNRYILSSLGPVGCALSFSWNDLQLVGGGVVWRKQPRAQNLTTDPFSEGFIALDSLYRLFHSWFHCLNSDSVSVNVGTIDYMVSKKNNQRAYISANLVAICKILLRLFQSCCLMGKISGWKSHEAIPLMPLKIKPWNTHTF